MTLNIRKAQLSDAPLLHRLGVELYRTYFGHMWVSLSEMNDYLDHEYSLPAVELSLKDPNVCWYVAETDQPVGFAKITWTSTIPCTDRSGVLLNKLYLARGETGKNYGRLIVEHIIRLAREHGKTFLWLEVLEKNERARQFYENLGMVYIKDTQLITASQQSILHILGMQLCPFN